MRRQFNYKRVTVHGHSRGDKQGHVREHLLIAERALGRPVPLGADVHHVNGDPLDNRPSNLVICQDRNYHFLLHVRTRVVKAGGNPNTQRICHRCKQLVSISDYSPKSFGPSGSMRRVCRSCNAARMAALNRVRGIPERELKLTATDAIDIYQRAHAGENQSAIAREYEIHSSVVNKIKFGHAWKHATQPDRWTGERVRVIGSQRGAA